MLWDLNEGKHLYSLEAGSIVNALVFSPNRYWLCAATASCVKIFDLESKWVQPARKHHLDPNLLLLRSIVDELKPAYTDVREDARQPECVSIAWSADGQTLFAGFTDNVLRVWTVTNWLYFYDWVFYKTWCFLQNDKNMWKPFADCWMQLYTANFPNLYDCYSWSFDWVKMQKLHFNIEIDHVKR